MAFVFDDDAMDCPKTPEHWSDVGPLQGRMAVLEQQLQSSQAQVAGLGQQVGMLGQQMRQVELELMMQRQQNEEIKVMLSQQLSGARKARPGPRERQRMREANLATELSVVASEPVSLVLEKKRCSRGRTSWVLLILSWLVYLLLREAVLDLQASEVEFVEDARRLSELGQLQLSVSDCLGASQLFERAIHLGNGTLSASELQRVRQRLGFAQVCGQQYSEGLMTLEDLEEVPVEVLNAAGYAHFQLGQVEEAEASWRKGLALAPENPVLWNNLGAARLGHDEAPLLKALELARQLHTGAQYYQQLISNNIHLHRRAQAGQPHPRAHVEIFNCLERELSVMVAATPSVQLEEQYKSVAGAEGAWPLWETRRAVLETEGERMLCP